MYVKSVRKKVAEMHNKIINCFPQKRGGESIPPSKNSAELVQLMGRDDFTCKTAMKIVHLVKILSVDVVVGSLVRPPSFVVMLSRKTLQTSQ